MKSKGLSALHKKRLQSIGNFISEYLFVMGMTQQQLSELSGLHRNTIQAICNHRIPHNYSIISLFKIADALDLSLNEVFIEI